MLNFFTVYLLLVLFFISYPSFAQDIDMEPCTAHVWEWATAIVTEESYGNKSIKTDALGNLYAFGSFSNQVLFSDSAYSSKGSTDLYLIKYNAEGLPLWTNVFGGKGMDEATATFPDGSGNVLVCGTFSDTLKIGDLKVWNSADVPDIFLAKFNNYGEVVWLKKFGGEGYDFPGDIVVDDDNNLYLSGGFEGTAEIGGSLINSEAGGNSFLLKLNPAGEKIWLVQYGNTSSVGIKLDLKSNNNIIMGGTFNDTLKIQDKKLTHNSNNVTFLAELSSEGDLLWLERTTGGTTSSALAAIAVDGAGAIYIGGSFFGITETAEFQLGDSLYLGSGGYIAKIEPDGSFGWSRRISSGLFNYISDIAIGNHNDVFATGLLSNGLTFGDREFTTFGGFITKYDEKGRELKLWKTGSFSYEYADFITSDIQGNIYATGLFEGTIPFGAHNISVEGGQNDAYIAKLSTGLPFMDAEPDLKASDLTFSERDGTGVTISWNNGDGFGRVVVMRKLGKVIAENIIDGSVYDGGNGEFGSGSDMGQRQYVVYNGTANAIRVTGLDPNRIYSVAVFEYNEDQSCPASINYKTDQFELAYLNTYESDPASTSGELVVYPNPVEEELNIILSTPIQGPKEMSLMDESGRLVYEFKTNITEEVSKFSVDISGYNLKAGTYFLKVKDEYLKQNTYRIIKK